jgi:hypothetical protein
MSSSSSSERTTTVTFQDIPKDMTKMGSAQTEVDTSSNANRNGHAVDEAPAPEAVSTTIFSLKGKVIIVTGGARGLGLTQAEALIEHGAIGMAPSPSPFRHSAN